MKLPNPLKSWFLEGKGNLTVCKQTQFVYAFSICLIQQTQFVYAFCIPPIILTVFTLQDTSGSDDKSARSLQSLPPGVVQCLQNCRMLYPQIHVLQGVRFQIYCFTTEGFWRGLVLAAAGITVIYMVWQLMCSLIGQTIENHVWILVSWY